VGLRRRWWRWRGHGRRRRRRRRRCGRRLGSASDCSACLPCPDTKRMHIGRREPFLRRQRAHLGIERPQLIERSGRIAALGGCPRSGKHRAQLRGVRRGQACLVGGPASREAAGAEHKHPCTAREPTSVMAKALHRPPVWRSAISKRDPVLASLLAAWFDESAFTGEYDELDALAEAKPSGFLSTALPSPSHGHSPSSDQRRRGANGTSAGVPVDRSISARKPGLGNRAASRR
jgi:hypothetical protein